MINWKLFKNFNENEFKSPDDKNCGEINVSILYMLQTIRNKYKKPVTITSGLRSQEYNDKLEGSIKNSDHVKGNAADFKIVGITDSINNRKEIMRFLAVFPGFKYAYCNGWILYANGTSKFYAASWMGTAIHVSITEN